jgi:hypothetical protein
VLVASRKGVQTPYNASEDAHSIALQYQDVPYGLVIPEYDGKYKKLSRSDRASDFFEMYALQR